MTDAITRQISGQVYIAIEGANSARPLPHSITYQLMDASPPTGRRGYRLLIIWSGVRSVAIRLKRLSLYRAARSTRGHGTHRSPPMTTPPKPQNVRKYYKFHEQSGHTTIECRELKKALHELADKGQIDRFLKKGPRFLRREQKPTQPQPRDEECSTEVIVTIAGGYAEGITRSTWKAQFRNTQQVLTTEQEPRVTAPTMVFGGKEASRCASSHNDPLAVEMKIVSIIIRRILINTGSSVDIITWDCLKKLAYPGRDIVPLVHPILGFGGQEVNPMGMIRLPVRFGNKLRSKNLEVDFLVVDVPTTYNVILGHLTLHKPADARPCSRGKPRNSCPPEILGPMSPKPYINTLGYQCSPTDSLAPWLEPPFPAPQPHQPRPSQAPPLVGVASSSCRLHGHPDQPSAFPNTAGADRSSPPWAKASAMATSSSVNFRGSEASGVTKSQDLTRS
ncbi:hypothetical protein Cgig2_002949 [Carnegiea gigantea]|uniref:Uncharacterized protein n=1 Tax=Carnegiea gigantea TaxID=171969 RepID=A0A9Q1Q735_9CARY|nr:hypothetical protein Cgig2_002949 [Carnegiea gigantea]